MTLTDAEVNKAGKAEYFASPLNTLKSYLNIDPELRKGDALPGIPIKDTANNELNQWIQSVNNVFLGDKLNLFVKGDKKTNYLAFKGVIDAFKKNDQMKFKIITSQQPIPDGTPLADRARKGTIKEE